MRVGKAFFHLMYESKVGQPFYGMNQPRTGKATQLRDLRIDVVSGHAFDY